MHLQRTMLSIPIAIGTVSHGAMIVDNWDANYKILSLFLYLGFAK